MSTAQNVLQKLNDREYDKLSFYRSVVRESSEVPSLKPVKTVKAGKQKTAKPSPKR